MMFRSTPQPLSNRFGRLPSAFISVGALDVFCDEDVDYATRLRHAGVPAELRVYAGAPHGFDSLTQTHESLDRRIETWAIVMFSCMATAMAAEP